MTILGCVASAPTPMPLTPPPVAQAGKGMIYIYSRRPPIELVGVSEGGPKVFIDERLAGTVGVGQYLAIEVDPGKHTLASQALFGFGLHLPLREGGSINAAPGGSHFFELQWSGGLEFFERAPEVGRDAIAGLKRVAPAPSAPPSGGEKPSVSFTPNT